MNTPYYHDEAVTLYHGDCREITAWLAADVLVTDPPYGRGAAGINYSNESMTSRSQWSHTPIIGDEDTTVRDNALAAWGQRPAIVFGDLRIVPPAGTKQVIIYQKPSDAGYRSTAGFRRDVEGIYLLNLPAGYSGRSSVIKTSASKSNWPSGPSLRYGHPHAKPVDVMEILISACPPGMVADPFAGSGSTLVAARNLGRKAIGVEIDERYCEAAARRLAQGILLEGIL